MLLQTIPNTIPWGILSAHLHDLLATDAKLSMQEATSLIAIYGAGAAAGGLFGGYIGARVYSSSRMLLPTFMGVTMMVSALLMQELLAMDLEVPGSTQLACPVLLLSGALAAVNGANIRVIILNLTYPEARGATIAVLNLVNCIGRGVGPMLVEVWMEASDMSRKHAVSFFLNLWLLSGSLLCIASSSIARDEDKMKAGLKKFAQTALETQTHKDSSSSSSSSSSSIDP
jgi:translation initiation factor 4G